MKDDIRINMGPRRVTEDQYGNVHFGELAETLPEQYSV